MLIGCEKLLFIRRIRPFTKSLKMNTRISVIEIRKTTDLKIEKTVSLLLFLTWFSLGFLFDYLLPQRVGKSAIYFAEVAFVYWCSFYQH